VVHGRDLDEALQEMAIRGQALGEALNEIHGLGSPFPSHSQLDALGALAMKTALAQTTWRHAFETIAPKDRDTFTDLVDGWAQRIEADSVSPRLLEEVRDMDINELADFIFAKIETQGKVTVSKAKILAWLHYSTDGQSLLKGLSEQQPPLATMRRDQALQTFAHTHGAKAISKQILENDEAASAFTEQEFTDILLARGAQASAGERERGYGVRSYVQCP
jgi:hypothetical protein